MTPLPSRHWCQSRKESGADRQQLTLLDQLGDRLGGRCRRTSRRQRRALFIDESADACFTTLGVYDRLSKQLRLARQPLLQTVLPTGTNGIDDTIGRLGTPDTGRLCEQTLRFHIAKRGRHIISAGLLPRGLCGASLGVAMCNQLATSWRYHKLTRQTHSETQYIFAVATKRIDQAVIQGFIARDRSTA